MFKKFEILNLIGFVLKWIGRDNLRPRIIDTLPSLFLLIISPFFSTLAFVLLPLAIFSSSDVPLKIPGLPELPTLTNSMDKWAFWVIPVLFLAFALTSYFGHRLVLRHSMIYQRSLSRRVSDFYYSMIRSGSVDPLLDVAVIRKLILGDSRYLARIYMSLYLLIPQLVMAMASFLALIYLVPKIMMTLIAVFIFFIPAYVFVANSSRQASAGFLEGAAKLSRYLPGALKDVATLPKPQTLSPSTVSDVILGDPSKEFFECFETRTRMTYVGALVSNVALAFMLVALIVLLPSVTQNDLALQVSLGVVLLIAARYFFGGVTAVVRILVAISNTYPYYGNYLRAFPNSRWAIGDEVVPDDRPSNPPELSGSSLGLVLVGTPQSGDENMLLIPGLGTFPRVRPYNILDWRKARNQTVQPENPAVSKIRSLDNQAVYSDAGGLIFAIADAVDQLGPIVLDEAEWRRINQKRRITLATILKEQAIPLWITSLDYDRFCKPEPESVYVVNAFENIVTEIAPEDSVLYLGGAPLQPLEILDLQSDKSSGCPDLMIYITRNRNSLSVVNKLLQNIPSRWVEPKPLNVSDFGDDKLDLKRLYSEFPSLSQFWDKLYENMSESAIMSTQSGHLVENLSVELIHGLAVALNSHPELLVFDHEVPAKLRQNQRPAFYKALEKAGLRIAIIGEPGQPELRPEATHRLAISAELNLVRKLDKGVNLPAPRTFSAEHKVQIGEVSLDIAIGETFGIVANQGAFDWTTYRHMKNLIGDAAPRLFQNPSIVSPNLLLGKTVSDIAIKGLAKIDFGRLKFLYPALAANWDEARKIHHLLLSFLESAGDQYNFSNKVTPRNAFYLTLASALTHNPETLYVREDDFRLLPQSERMKIASALKGILIVVWKNHMRGAFIKPRSPHALMLENSGVIAITKSEFNARDILPSQYKRLIAEPFKSPSADLSDIMIED